MLCLSCFCCPAPGQAAPQDRESPELLRVRRVYVDRLTGGETAAQIRDMIISRLHNARLFVITENADTADANLRGAAEDLVFTDTFYSSEGINAQVGGGVGSERSSSTSTSRGRYARVGVGENETTRIAERRHEAMASVRLVNKAGDVIWSTTQESLGGKFLGASADVADKIARQLIADHQGAKRTERAPH